MTTKTATNNSTHIHTVSHKGNHQEFRVFGVCVCVYVIRENTKQTTDRTMLDKQNKAKSFVYRNNLRETESERDKYYQENMPWF